MDARRRGALARRRPRPLHDPPVPHRRRADLGRVRHRRRVPGRDGVISVMPPERGERDQVQRDTVVPLELFFDLVIVFAFTQVTTLMSADPTWAGMLRGVLLLIALWWLWTGFARLTNAVDPEEGLVRLVMLSAVAAMLIMSLAAPLAFGRDAVTFAVTYGIARGLHVVLSAVAAGGDSLLRRETLRLIPNAAVCSSLLVA